MKYSIAKNESAAIVGLLFATVTWGMTFILVKWTVAEMDVYNFMFIRFSLAFLCLAIAFRRHLRTSRATIRAAFILSIFLAGAYITQTEGLRFTTASNSALITGLYIVLVPLFSAVIFRTRPTMITTIGMI
ncbi:MAG: DMT family transporter, partial [Deltaproteobacteria bacterium]|nr:DMT family transporter [Deltaproteobacteria bacterium]